MATVRTYQPRKRHRSKVHGFRKRMATANGRKVLARRRAKGRAKLSAYTAAHIQFGVNGSSSVRPICLSAAIQRWAFMQFSSSLKLNHIFRRLYRKGSSAANGYLVLYCRKNGSQANRVGLTVGAKLAHAVQRNRLRRQLREIYRLHETSFARGYDLVVVARSRAIGADYAALEHAYLSLAARLGLLTQNTP